MSQRLDRINELMKREISTVILKEFEFPGSLVTISDVQVTQDLREASSNDEAGGASLYSNS